MNSLMDEGLKTDRNSLIIDQGAKQSADMNRNTKKMTKRVRL